MTERGRQFKRGVLVGDELDPQPVIREVGEKNKDWDYSHEVTKLYRRSETIIDELYPVIHTPSFQGRLPSILIGVGDLRNRKTLAAYNLVPDDYGLKFKITFNEKHYVDGKDEEGKPTKVWRYGEWAQMETLVHEAGHHWQQMLGKDPYKPGKRVTHNKEFNDKMEELGIYCAPEGYHYKVAREDSPFGRLMRMWGIQPPADVPKGEPTEIHWFFVDKEPKGRSSLQRWCCMACGTPIRYGRQDDPEIRHAKCERELGREPIYFIPGRVYDANKKENAG